LVKQSARERKRGKKGGEEGRFPIPTPYSSRSWGKEKGEGKGKKRENRGVPLLIMSN